MGLNEFVQKNERNVILGIYVFLLCLPSIFPSAFPAPIVVQNHTQLAFNAIEDLVVPGAHILIENSIMMTAYGVSKQAAMDVLIHIFSKPDTSIIMYSCHDWARSAPTLMIEQMLPKALPIAEDLRGEEIVYGEDYCVFPWYPGAITAVSTFADDCDALLLYDYYGTPFDEIPVTEGWNTGADADLIYHMGSEIGEIRVMYARFSTPIIQTHSSRILTGAIQNIQAGSVTGVVVDILGAAEYEQLLLDNFGVPGIGEGLAGVGGGYITNGYFLVLFFVGNLFLRKRR
jgi:hypothetical protein